MVVVLVQKSVDIFIEKGGERINISCIQIQVEEVYCYNHAQYPTFIVKTPSVIVSLDLVEITHVVEDWP